jgi:hypothetical protein
MSPKRRRHHGEGVDARIIVPSGFAHRAPMVAHPAHSGASPGETSMADVSGNTLLMAVQAVDDAIRTLDRRLRHPQGDPRHDTDMRVSYARAAEELRAAYEVARLGSSNLPPYATLVGADGS